MDATIVIVTHDSAPLLQTHLGSLPRALDGIDNYEVVVVDSGSSDSTLDDVRRLLPSARVIDMGTNRGYSAGINAGIAGSSLEASVVVLNPDTIPANGSLTRLVQALETTGTGICAPRLVDEHGATQRCLRRRPTVLRSLGDAVGGGRAGRFEHLGETVQKLERYEHGSVVDWASGAVLAISRPCIDAVGAWDESYFLYSEETDFALRAGELGFATRYVPDAVVMHRGGDSHISPLLFSLLTVNRVRLYRGRSGRMGSTLYWLSAVINCSLRAAVGSRPHQMALRNLFRPPQQVVTQIRQMLSS